MFDTTKDILFFVLSICIVFFTFFLCYLFFYVAKIIKRVDRLLTSIEEQFERLHRTIESGFSYMTVISDGVKLLLSYVMDKKDAKKGRK